MDDPEFEEACSTMNQRSLAAYLSLAACFSAAACANETSVFGEHTPRFQVTVAISNVGDGFGRVTVEFPPGHSVTGTCTAVLAPDGECAATAVGTTAMAFVELQVAAEPGSRFVEWTGVHCGGTSTECLIDNTSSEEVVTFDIEPRFDLDPGTR